MTGSHHNPAGYSTTAERFPFQFSSRGVCSLSKTETEDAASRTEMENRYSDTSQLEVSLSFEGMSVLHHPSCSRIRSEGDDEVRRWHRSPASLTKNRRTRSLERDWTEMAWWRLRSGARVWTVEFVNLVVKLVVVVFVGGFPTIEPSSCTSSLSEQSTDSSTDAWGETSSEDSETPSSSSSSSAPTSSTNDRA